MRAALFALLVVAAGCNKKHVDADVDKAPHHEHVAPQGGTAVELGEEQNHLELVLDKTNGVLDVYVLDGELENFIRVDLPEITFVTQVPDHPEATVLVLKPVENRATGEKIGDTSLFEGKAEWLKSTSAFQAKIRKLRIKGTTYENVEVRFPSELPSKLRQ